jgi:septum formation protein
MDAIMMQKMEIILASASPRRTELLQQLDVEFRVIPSDAEEIHDGQLTATEVAQINAYRKARAVAKKFPDALVIGADTLVYLGTRLYGKPANMTDAHRMLDELQGRTHEVVTGVCLVNLREHHQKIFAETTQVTFRPLTSELIDLYLRKINPLDKAGAYAIQEGGEIIVKESVGSFSNVVGLPLERLEEELDFFLRPVG